MNKKRERKRKMNYR